MKKILKKALKIIGLILLTAVIVLSLGAAISEPFGWANVIGTGVFLLILSQLRRYDQRHRRQMAPQ